MGVRGVPTRAVGWRRWSARGTRGR